MDVLASVFTLEKFKEGILDLPHNLDSVYASTLVRIRNQIDVKRELAINVLMWLVFAKRPLRLKELQHALIVRAGDKSLVKDRISSLETWTSACAGIVDTDQSLDTVGLAHYTAEKYLRANENLIFQDNQSMMADTCLLYLKFQDFGQVIAPNKVIMRQQEYPFYKYAADHWGSHLYSAAAKKSHQLADIFLSDSPKVMGSFQVMSETRFQREANITGLHVAAYFGLVKLAKKMIKTNPKSEMNAKTQDGETALHWAAFYGHQQFLRLLIDEGADLNIQDKNGRSALHSAMFRDDLVSVKTLLSSGKVNVNLEDSSPQRWTALRWAAAYGNQTIVEHLLRNGADIDAQDNVGWNALRWAAHRNARRIIELLLREGASLEPSSGDRWTLLEWAAREGKNHFIKLLIDKRPQVNLCATNSQGWTALRWAVEYGHGMAAWLLMSAQPELINHADNESLSPLHSVIENWTELRDKSLLWLILEKRAKIDARTKAGLTALHLATERGHNSVVWLLLEKGADTKAVTKLGLTSLHIAAKQGHTSVVLLLLENGAKIHAQTKLGLTTLHFAAENNHSSLISLLLEKGADINAQTKLGRTSLHLAATRGHSSVISILLDRGANVSQVDKNGQTALHCAVIEGHFSVVQFLCQKVEGLVRSVDEEKQTPLHLAASNGDLPILKLLLDHGARLDAQDNRGHTPWKRAMSHEHRHVLDCLDLGRVNGNLSHSHPGKDC